MKKIKIQDSIDPKIKFSIEENASEVDGVNVLAKVKGVFFVPNGVSRNNRFYSKGLWEKALSEEHVQEKFKNRNMFGTVGHNIEINDETLSEGKFSHIVTNAYIDDNGQGIGEAIILNTRSGRALNTVLRAGATVYVSSRGEGTFEGNKNGVPAVDESNYNLIGWDFVLNPGFLKASPTLAEAYQEIDEIHKSENKEGDKPMEKVLERLNDELVTVKSKYESSLTETKSLKESVTALSEENNHVKAELAKSESALTETEKELSAVKEELEKFKTLGESFESVQKALIEADAYISKVHERLGSFDRIEKALQTALTFKESVDALGTLSEIKETMEIAESMVAIQETKEQEDRIASLAKSIGVGGEAVAVLAAKGMSDEDIKTVLTKVGESVKASLPAPKKVKEEKKVENKNESLVKKDKKAEVIDEKKIDEETPSYAKKTRLDRVMEGLL